MATDPYASTYDAAGQAFNVDPGVLAGIAATESSNGKYRLSPAGARGLMGIMPATAQGLGVNPDDDTQAIWGAANLMSQNLAATGGNVPDALRMYNAGPNRAHWNNPETQAYVGKVASAYQPQQTVAPSVAPAGSPAVPQAAPPAVDPAAVSAMDQAWGVGASAPAAAAVSPTSAAPSDVAAQDQLWGVGQSSAAQPAPPAGGLGSSSGTAMATTDQPGFFSRLGAGIQRGVRDVRDTADAIDAKVPFLNNLDAAAGFSSGPAAIAQDQQQLQDYNAQHGDSLVSGLGRVAGNALGTLPLTVATGAAINPLTGAAAEALGGGGLSTAARLLGGVATGAAQGGVAGAATSAGQGQSIGEAAQGGALAGGALGGAMGLAGRLLPATLPNAVTGVAPQARAELAQTAGQYGIDLTPGQVSGSNPLRRIGQAVETMGGGDPALAAQQQQAFNRAALQTVGVDAPAATQQVMAQARQQISDTYDRVLSGAPPINTNTDPTVLNTLTTIDHGLTGVPAPEATAVRDLMDHVVGAASSNNGQITPGLYQTLIQNGGPLSNAMASDDPTISRSATAIKDALDTSFTNGLQAAGQGQQAQDLQAARFAYKNLKTLEPIVNKSPLGDISPSLLQGRVNIQFNNRAYQGAGNLGQLADIGQTFLKPLSSSGTPEQGNALYNLVQGGNVAQRLLSGDVHGALGAGAAMVARPLVARATGAIVNSPALGQAMIARSLGAPSFTNNALALAGAAAPALTVGGAVPAINLLLGRRAGASTSP